MGFGEKKWFFHEFLPLLYIVWRSGGYGPKYESIAFGPILASLYLKTMIPLFLCNSASKF